MSKGEPKDLYMDDGISHINVHRFAKTTLGLMLNNSYEKDLSMVIDSKLHTFSSVEDYIVFLAKQRLERKGTSYAAIKDTFGNGADLAYKELVDKEVKVVLVEDRGLIEEAISRKITMCESLLDLFVNSDLPFRQYSVYGRSKRNRNVVTMREDLNFSEFLTNKRDELKKLF